jgi:hypothetical protein
MKKYKLEIEFETDEIIDGGTKPEDIDSLLEGSWLYDTDFRGVITKSTLKKIKISRR